MKEITKEEVKEMSKDKKIVRVFSNFRKVLNNESEDDTTKLVVDSISGQPFAKSNKFYLCGSSILVESVFSKEYLSIGGILKDQTSDKTIIAVYEFMEA